MTTPRDNRRAFDALAWTLAALALFVLLTSSCSPYGPVVAEQAQRETPSATATEQFIKFDKLNTPAPYWQLAAENIQRLIGPATTSGKVNYTTGE